MRTKEKNFVSATVYLYNAAQEAERFGTMLVRVLEENFEHSEIIFINDHSADDSAEAVKRVSGTARTTSVSLLNMSYFQGREAAMNAGLDLAIGDFVFEFDTTFVDYTQKDIMDVYDQALEGFDMVSASPDRKMRRTSRLFYRILDRFSDTPYSMTSERFRILSRRVINRVMSMNNDIPYRKAVYSHCGLKTKHIVYPAAPDQNGRIYDKRLGHTEKRYRRNLGIDVLLLFTGVGYRFSIGMTVTMILVTVFMFAYSLVVYLFGSPVEGWTTTILFFSFAFFGLFGLLTIVIKYLQILVDLVFKRKRYSFESLEKLTR